VRPPPAPPPQPTAELQETLDDFGALQKLWLAYTSPCSEERCPICQSNNDGKQGNEDDLDNKDDKDDNENDEENEEDDKEDEEGDEDISSSRKGEKRLSKRQSNSTGQQPSPQDFDTKKSFQANKHRKKPNNTERDWMTSAPYDESIPYSHRYGYTWAGTTSNELMKLWQVYRKPADD